MPPTLSLARPLLETLGARWRVGVSAVGVAWEMTTGLAGFALRDGTLALAHPVWDGAPALRTRDRGGVELIPAATPAPPAARAKAHQGTCLSVAADPDGGFLTGGTDGRMTRVQTDGTVQAIAHFDGPVSLVAAGPGHWRTGTVRNTVHRLGAAASRIDVPSPVSALTIDPGGAKLAAGHNGGITLWAGGDAPRVLEAPGLHGGVAWGSDRTFLSSLTSDGILHAWRSLDTEPSKVETGEAAASLGVLVAGFVAGVGGRVLCWHPPASQLLQCGVRNKASVTRVAGHPCRQLVAAGYANGTVVLCQPNSSALLLLRAAGKGAVSALAFSRTGDHLAIGTDGGEIGVVALPDKLFRDQAGQP